MTPSLVIAGQRRALGHVPSWRRVAAVRPSIDLASLPMRLPWPDAFPRDYDQGSLNACGPNALAEQYQYHLIGTYSRLFAYYFARGIERDTADDGVTIVDLMDVAMTLGLPAEFLWPYDATKLNEAPPTIAVSAAQACRVTDQGMVADLEHLLYELAAGNAVLCGVGLPASIEDGKGDTATTGIVPVPNEADPLIGGHCINAVAYDRKRQMVQCTSHWGASYGDAGTLWLGFDHWAAGNVSDMRAVRKIGAV